MKRDISFRENVKELDCKAISEREIRLYSSILDYNFLIVRTSKGQSIAKIVAVYTKGNIKVVATKIDSVYKRLRNQFPYPKYNIEGRIVSSPLLLPSDFSYSLEELEFVE